jgi:hypothetical protein
MTGETGKDGGHGAWHADSMAWLIRQAGAAYFQ